MFVLNLIWIECRMRVEFLQIDHVNCCLGSCPDDIPAQIQNIKSEKSKTAELLYTFCNRQS